MVAAVAQAAALATGPIALVQPIFIIELPVTLVLAALANHNRAALRRLPWTAIIITTAALGAGLAIAQAERRDRRRAGHQLGHRTIAAGAAFLAVLIGAAVSGTRGEPRAALLRARRGLRATR